MSLLIDDTSEVLPASTADSMPPSDSVMRTSDWTCRLPKEIMDKILLMLFEVRDRGSLRKLQSASSAMYLVATPYLYRHLHLGAYRLFRLSFPLMSRRLDLKTFGQDLANNLQHPLDLHVYHRFRWALSHVKKIRVYPTDPASEHCPDHYIKAYTSICSALNLFDLPNLWPALDTVKVETSCWSRDWRNPVYLAGPPYRFGFPHCVDLFTALLASLRPDRLDVSLPPLEHDRDANGDGHWYARPPSAYSDLEANHVTVEKVTAAFCIDSIAYLLDLFEGISPDPLRLRHDHKTRLHPSIPTAAMEAVNRQVCTTRWTRSPLCHQLDKAARCQLFNSQSPHAQLVESTKAYADQ